MALIVIEAQLPRLRLPAVGGGQLSVPDSPTGPNAVIVPRVVASPPTAIVTVGCPDGGGELSVLVPGGRLMLVTADARLSLSSTPSRQTILT